MNTTAINYSRVIPRDFFNEAKLLKCFGQLSLKMLDNQVPEGVNISIEESGEPFDICLSSEGGLYIANYETTINNVPVIFVTTYNSKSAYPFFCQYDYCDYEVFNEDGEFTEEFINFSLTLNA